MAIDWYDTKFLESATNVRELIHRSTGRRPSASIAREIAVCVQQGRLFFEAATAAPIQIKPLLIYYGVVGFARAIIVARKSQSLSTLTAAHGLRDITQPEASIERLVLRCESAGSFHEFNDAIAPLGRIWYYDRGFMPRWWEKPFDSAEGLSGQTISITDVLSRVPGLSEKFNQTFASSAKSIPISLQPEPIGRWKLRIDDPTPYTDQASLIEAVRKATNAWGNAILLFDNTVEPREGDLTERNLIPGNNNGFATAWGIAGANPDFVSPEKILPPLSGGYVAGSGTYAMQPIGGVNLPEYSLQFLGCFLLSSLVRYRPQIWQHAISRSITQKTPADDRSLSLIEQFLDGVLNEFPNMVVRVVDYQRT